MVDAERAHGLALAALRTVPARPPDPLGGPLETRVAGLAFANPLMPAEVSLYHFWEVSISTGIFGALCAWFVPSHVSTIH